MNQHAQISSLWVWAASWLNGNTCKTSVPFQSILKVVTRFRQEIWAGNTAQGFLRTLRKYGTVCLFVFLTCESSSRTPTVMLDGFFGIEVLGKR